MFLFVKYYFCDMKILSRLLLILFIAFLLTPTVVTIIEKNTDVSMFYSFTEEEIHKDLKEIKCDLRKNFEYVFLTPKISQNSIIISENLSKHDKISDEIFSPPPELL